MISPNSSMATTDQTSSELPACVVLVRYGAVPQVARFGVSEHLYAEAAGHLAHDSRVVVHSERGPEVGQLLEVVRPGTAADENPVTGDVLRIASSEDLRRQSENRLRSNVDFPDWQKRIADWKLQLQLIDIEWTLDGKQIILYVLNGQDAETTRLALLAAAAGQGIIHVQPVAAEGIVQKTSGGCGSGGCGSGGCGH